jgi:hypothetical protein
MNGDWFFGRRNFTTDGTDGHGQRKKKAELELVPFL